MLHQLHFIAPLLHSGELNGKYFWNYFFFKNHIYPINFIYSITFPFFLSIRRPKKWLSILIYSVWKIVSFHFCWESKLLSSAYIYTAAGKYIYFPLFIWVFSDVFFFLYIYLSKLKKDSLFFYLLLLILVFRLIEYKFPLYLIGFSLYSHETRTNSSTTGHQVHVTLPGVLSAVTILIVSRNLYKIYLGCT